jgi:hypothetical protein
VCGLTPFCQGTLIIINVSPGCRMIGKHPLSLRGTAATPFNALTSKATPTLRTPAVQGPLSNRDDQVVFENYDDSEYGYLRLIADQQQLRIEYHPASDGDAAKTPDDSVTVDLATRRIVPYKVP